MERRKDPVLKKIVLLCSVAALVAIYCFSAYSELSQLPTNLSVNEEEARSIMESRALRLVAPSEDEGIPDLKINGIAPLYDAETSTFYYSLSDDSRRWPSLHFTLNGEEVDGQLAFLEDFMSESREAVLAESTRIPFILYDDETYRQYYLTFSTLPLMQITLDEFPEGNGGLHPGGNRRGAGVAGPRLRRAAEPGCPHRAGGFLRPHPFAGSERGRARLRDRVHLRCPHPRPGPQQRAVSQEQLPAGAADSGRKRPLPAH